MWVSFGDVIHEGKLFLKGSIFRSVFAFWVLLKFTEAFGLVTAPGLVYSPSKYLLFSFAIELLALAFLTKLLPSEVKGPLDTLQIFSAIFLTIPLISITFTNTRFSLFTNYMALIFLIIYHLLLRLFEKLLKINSNIHPPAKTSETKVIVVMMLLSVFLVTYVVFFGQFRFDISAFNSVYQRRAEFMESLNVSRNVLFGYAFGWLGGLIAPVIFLFGIYLKRYMVITFSLMLGVFVYAAAAQKWVLASYFFLILIFYIYKKKPDTSLSLSLHLNTFNWLIVIALLLQTLFLKFRIIDLAIRRSLLDPAIMMQHYVQFTREYPLRFWSDLKITQFFMNEDAAPASRIIGDRYFDIPERFIFPQELNVNATSGAVADSLSQAGLLGLFVTTLLMFLFFLLLEILSKNKSRVLVLCICALTVQMLIEGTLHTLMLTRGLILVPLILYFLPNRENFRRSST